MSLMLNYCDPLEQFSLVPMVSLVRAAISYPAGITPNTIFKQYNKSFSDKPAALNSDWVDPKLPWKKNPWLYSLFGIFFFGSSLYILLLGKLLVFYLYEILVCSFIIWTQFWQNQSFYEKAISQVVNYLKNWNTYEKPLQLKVQIFIVAISSLAFRLLWVHPINGYIFWTLNLYFIVPSLLSPEVAFLLLEAQSPFWDIVACFFFLSYMWPVFYFVMFDFTAQTLTYDEYKSLPVFEIFSYDVWCHIIGHVEK